MEIINIKENMISQSLQEPIPERVNKSEQSDQRAWEFYYAHDGVEDLLMGVSKGDPEAMKSLMDEKINHLAERANQVAESMRHSIQFVVNREAGKVVINVVDSGGNVIFRIPPEALKSATSGMDANRGLLLNTEL